MTKEQAEIACVILKGASDAMKQIPMTAEDHETAKFTFTAVDAVLAYLHNWNE